MADVMPFGPTDVIESPSRNKRSQHFDSKAKRHKTTKRRKGPSKGGAGIIARLRFK